MLAWSMAMLFAMAICGVLLVGVHAMGDIDEETLNAQVVRAVGVSGHQRCSGNVVWCNVWNANADGGWNVAAQERGARSYAKNCR
jgi:hypothetical protein